MPPVIYECSEMKHVTWDEDKWGAVEGFYGCE